jgi:hypothetical protein
MKSSTTSKFWKLYKALPPEIQKRADRAYQLWQLNPQAKGLYFKRVGKQQPIYSVRIGQGCRALGLLNGDEILWFWIGLHDEYEQLLKHL